MNRKRLWVQIGVGLVPAFLLILSEIFGLGAFGLVFTFFILLIPTCAVVALIASVLQVLVPRPRLWFGPFLIFCGVYVLTAYPAMRVSITARRFAFGNLASRSELLVRSLETYQRDHGSPAPSLQALVPQYIPEIPHTGMPGYPKYEYEVFSTAQAKPLNPPEIQHDLPPAPWELRVPCPIGFINWDVFFYWPGQQYPESAYGGTIERIGTWAYVHE